MPWYNVGVYTCIISWKPYGGPGKEIQIDQTYNYYEKNENKIKEGF